MVVITGKTEAAPLVVNSPTSSGYDLTPLLTTGDEVPLISGGVNGFTYVPGKTFALTGTPDGMGIFATEDNYFLYVNHEYGATRTTFLSSDDSDGKVIGSRISLFVFDKDWNVLGGKNVVETVVSGDVTYTFDSASGNFVDPSGKILNFGAFCSAYLATEGFEGGPIYFQGEEVLRTGRALAVDVNGTATVLDGLGRYSKENVLPASQYRATNSDKTVLFSTEDAFDGDGELYMWVGQQSAADPNGLKNGDLYVLRVSNFDGEGQIVDNTPLTATWTKVDKSVIFDANGKALDNGDALTAWVNAEGRSTNFRRVEDISEDPNNPGTFYFNVTGTKHKPTDGLTATATTAAEAENPYGRVYRFTLNPTDPTGSISNFEAVLSGGPGKGVSYDNIVVDRNGLVWLQEDETAFGEDVMRQEGRDASVWTYNIATKAVNRVFDLYEATGGRADLGVGSFESSGIIELNSNALPDQSSLLFNIQGHGYSNPRYAELGQIVLASPLKPTVSGTSASDVLLGNNCRDVITGGSGNDYIWGGHSGQDKLLGGSGDDQINGNSDPNTLNGGNGNNQLYGNGGNDIFIAGDGNDVAYGESGNDIFNLGNGNNRVFANDGNNWVTTGNGDDWVHAGSGKDVITGGDGNNDILAGDGFNQIATGSGNDIIWSGKDGSDISAGAGDDTIYASGGNNKINAGTGNDVITVGWHGKGVDTFVLNAGTGSTTIFGFETTDKIALGSNLKKEDLTISISGYDTLISKGDDLLATLKWVQVNSVTFS